MCISLCLQRKPPRIPLAWSFVLRSWLFTPWIWLTFLSNYTGNYLSDYRCCSPHASSFFWPEQAAGIKAASSVWSCLISRHLHVVMITGTYSRTRENRPTVKVAPWMIIIYVIITYCYCSPLKVMGIFIWCSFNQNKPACVRTFFYVSITHMQKTQENNIIFIQLQQWMF